MSHKKKQVAAKQDIECGSMNSSTYDSINGDTKNTGMDITMEEYNLENTKDTSVQENAENLITERQFLDVICRDYTSVHYGDLVNDIAEPLKVALSANAGRIDRIKVRKKIGYTDIVKSYCENFVCEDNQKEFLRIMDRDFLMKQLAESDLFV